MRRTCLAAGLSADGSDIDVDLDAKVRFAHSNHAAQAAKFEVRIALRIAGNDYFAAAPDQFIDTQILKVATVRNIHE